MMTQIREEACFTKGRKTEHVWYYEHPYPPGAKSYNKGKPIRIEQFEAERAWWGKPDKKGLYSKREENEQAWCVYLDTIKAGNFNLDLKNPHNPDEIPLAHPARAMPISFPRIELPASPCYKGKMF